METRCANPGDFKKYFNENMQALGLVVPGSLFDTFEKAVETATKMAGALHVAGPGATIGELVGATFGLEKLIIVTGVAAAGYTGAVVGSIFVASVRSFGCGMVIADLFVFMQVHGLVFDGWNAFFVNNPQVVDTQYIGRKSFAIANAA